MFKIYNSGNKRLLIDNRLLDESHPQRFQFPFSYKVKETWYQASAWFTVLLKQAYPPQSSTTYLFQSTLTLSNPESARRITLFLHLQGLPLMLDSLKLWRQLQQVNGCTIFTARKTIFNIHKIWTLENPICHFKVDNIIIVWRYQHRIQFWLISIRHSAWRACSYLFRDLTHAVVMAMAALNNQGVG